MKILNDKYGLSYLSGNAQILFANTGSTQQFNTIVANTFTNLGNTFTINTAGIFGANVVTSGNVSAANIVISGNLFLKEGFGNVGDFLRRTATGIGYVTSLVNGGTFTDTLTIANSAVAANLNSGALSVQGGMSVWGNIYANNNVVLSGTASITTLNAIVSNNNTLQANNFSTANAQIVGGNAALTTIFASNLNTANASITGGNIGMNYNKVVSLIGNVYTGNLFAGNLSSSNVTISGGYISSLANITVNNITYANSIIESVAIHAGTAPNGTMPINLLSNSTHYYTPSATATWTPNVRASASVPLNSYLATGQQISFSMIVNQGATAYNNSSGQIRIDNTLITAKWPGAVLPVATASRTEVYTYTILKLGNASWIVFGSNAAFTA